MPRTDEGSLSPMPDPVARDWQSRIVESCDGHRCVGTLGSADDLVQTIIRKHPQGRAEMPGQEPSRRDRESMPVRAVTMPHRRGLRSARNSKRCEAPLTAGASAFLSKDDLPEAVGDVLQRIAQSETLCRCVNINSPKLPRERRMRLTWCDKRAHSEACFHILRITRFQVQLLTALSDGRLGMRMALSGMLPCLD
jgi:hypothetical protein